ncbi:uncharacterized protein Triagg1_238 [Trichoderma aggressivum f. europaeum]|uniref:Uncharacterized protein n=1 Tax=Trichoderma aggressivum f. europaeum TaxID=173218 RepID=A0AAE1IL12_9HYPO|nr:hypothetical protein Triagg1_238 [Trichoderma aggressivum f. europaeum]
MDAHAPANGEAAQQKSSMKHSLGDSTGGELVIDAALLELIQPALVARSVLVLQVSRFDFCQLQGIQLDDEFCLGEAEQIKSRSVWW